MTTKPPDPRYGKVDGFSRNFQGNPRLPFVIRGHLHNATATPLLLSLTDPILAQGLNEVLQRWLVRRSERVEWRPTPAGGWLSGVLLPNREAVLLDSGPRVPVHPHSEIRVRQS